MSEYEYKITKRDVEDADLLLRKFENTQWEIKELLLQALRKRAHLAELARSLSYLPAMKKIQEKVDDIAREGRFNFENELSSFHFFIKFYNEGIEPIRKHLWELGKDFKEEVVVQCVCEMEENND